MNNEELKKRNEDNAILFSKTTKGQLLKMVSSTQH